MDRRHYGYQHHDMKYNATQNIEIQHDYNAYQVLTTVMLIVLLHTIVMLGVVMLLSVVVPNRPAC